ncbi:glycosyltransferase family 9 protein [Desulfoplanes sp.]
MHHKEHYVIVHKGALGDFLMAWPAMAILRKNFPEKKILWAGQSSRMPLLRPLDIDCAPADVRQAIRSLYRDGVSGWGAQTDKRIIWFCLEKKPFRIKHENIFFLHGIHAGSFMPPRSLFIQELAALGIASDHDWLGVFRTAFPRQGPPDNKTVLVFPGSGNPAKNWPQVQFFKLCSRLTRSGWEPVMVLGPVEQEQGSNTPDNLATARPQTTEDLIALLQKAAYVVGNDSGPMHLAGYMGVPGLSIFGPTSPKQWGPLGMDILRRNLACSPCTQTARVSCADPACIREIPLDRVIARIEHGLAKQPQAPKNGAGS